MRQNLKKWLDNNKDGKITQAEAKKMLSDTSVKLRLSRAICQFSTEWSESLVDSQYSWVTKKSDENPDPLTADDFSKFKTYVGALSFWDKVPELPPKDKVWHFHPREFIKHFRKCLWLSLNELKQIMPSHAMRQSKGTYLWERIDLNTKDTSAIVTLRNDLNISCRKYFIDSSWRLVSFLSNALQETMWLNKMYENGSIQRYYPWDGRGYLQLTWASNYLNFWEFKGKQIASNVKKSLLDAEEKINKDRNNIHYKNLENSLPEEVKNLRSRVGQNGTKIAESRDAAESAGFYWSLFKMASFSDKQHLIEKVTINTNQGRKSYYRSNAFWKCSASVNLPAAVNKTNYSGINGFDARCCVYGTGLAILNEIKFEGSDFFDYPESFIRRPL